MVASLRKSLSKASLSWHLQALDYRFLLPLLARLPISWGRWLSKRRGILNFQLGRDWTELSVGFPYISQRTADAANLIWPQLDRKQIVRERYVRMAEEEWQSMLIEQERLLDLSLDLSALKEMLQKRHSDRGLVVLTAHFGSFIVGMMGLGLCGQKTSVTSSSVYKSLLVHPAVQQFFDKRYKAGERYLAGGGFKHVESSTITLMRALLRHETVVVVADGPAVESGNGLWVSWLGAERKLAGGGVRMAKSTGSLLCAMVCLSDDSGNVRWLCSDIYDPQTDAQSVQKCFAHLEKAIIDHPGHWWASHLLNDYPTRSVDSD